MKENIYKKRKTQKKSVRSRFPWLQNFFRKISDEIMVSYIPHMLFLSILGVIYIYINYNIEKLTREVIDLENGIEKLRVDYNNLKYEYIRETKQSEIAKKVKPLGVIENDKPIVKIIIDE